MGLPASKLHELCGAMHMHVSSPDPPGASPPTHPRSIRAPSPPPQNTHTLLPGCQFHYQPPRRDFDARKVRGVVAQLVRVKDPAAALALEVAAGGKLYQVGGAGGGCGAAAAAAGCACAWRCAQLVPVAALGHGCNASYSGGALVEAEGASQHHMSV